MLAATDIGIFRTTDGGKTWAAFNLGVIPAVAVFDIEQNLSGVVFAATHGRGIFELTGEGSPASTPFPRRPLRPSRRLPRPPAATPTATATPTARVRPSATATELRRTAPRRPRPPPRRHYDGNRDFDADRDGKCDRHICDRDSHSTATATQLSRHPQRHIRVPVTNRTATATASSSATATATATRTRLPPPHQLQHRPSRRRRCQPSQRRWRSRQARQPFPRR